MRARCSCSCRCGSDAASILSLPQPQTQNISARAALPRFRVARLDLTDFRCYRALRLESDGRSVVLTGPNGAGKTNLLEALSLLAPGRGMRRASLRDLARRESHEGESRHLVRPWAVAARIETPDGALDIGTGLAPAEGESERRIVRVNGEPASGPSALADYLDVLWLIPQMDRLFIEGPSARRRFLDRLVFGEDPGHARRVTAFEKAMRERNRLLSEGRFDDTWASALEAAMAGPAVAVAAARRAALLRINAALAEAPGAFPVAHLDVAGMLEARLAEEPALAVEDAYRALLARNRALDAAAGATTEGPHRSDLLVRHVGRNRPAGECSTGEQKALLIAIVLATARLASVRRGAAPLLLLDEIVAHLDATRREALFDALETLGAQAWLTGTDAAPLLPLGSRAQFLTVEDGQVRPLRA